MEKEIEYKLTEEARAQWLLTDRIMEWIWKRGISGKLAIALLAFAIYAPLVVALLALVWAAVTWYATPLAIGERVTLLGIMLLTIDSAGLWIMRYTWPNIVQWYFRKRRTGSLSKSTPKLPLCQETDS